ncbi:MAG: DUF2254 family protein [Pseudomonadota bacterium]
MGFLRIDCNDTLPVWLAQSTWIYNGGGTGARTLLGKIASSAIGVAAMVFSITIAALSLAAGQMRPRLLRNFTRDRGVQLTLGAFLGTFSYALCRFRPASSAKLYWPSRTYCVVVFAIMVQGLTVGRARRSLAGATTAPYRKQ